MKTTKNLTVLGLTWVIILASIDKVEAQNYYPETFVQFPGTTCVDKSPDGTKILGRMTFGSWNEGYRIFDADDYSTICDLTGMWAPWTGMFSRDSGYIYTTVYYDGSVKKFQICNSTAVKIIPVGPWPHGLVFDSQHRFLYVGVNAPGTGAIGSVKKIDTDTDTVVGTTQLNSEPGQVMVVDPADQFLYVYARFTNTVYKIRTLDCSVAGTIVMPPCAPNPGVSVSPGGETVYVPSTNTNKVYLVDTSTMSVSGDFSFDFPVHCFYVSPDGTHAIVYDYSAPIIRIFDLTTENITQTFDFSSYYSEGGSHNTTPYWDEATGRVYAVTPGGIAVLRGVPEPAIEATVDIDPNTLNLQSKGQSISCYIELPEGYDVDDIDVSSILLEYLLEVQHIDVQDDVLMVKFDRQDLIIYLESVVGVIPPDDIPLTVTGELKDGRRFEGTDTIRVIDEGKKKE